MTDTDPLDGEQMLTVLTELRDFLASNVEVNGRPLGTAVTIDPPSTFDSIAVVIGPPAFAYECFGIDPNSATCEVFVIVPNDSRMTGNLMAMALGVANAIHAGTSHEVLSSTPGTWVDGVQSIPAYLLSVSLDLNTNA